MNAQALHCSPDAAWPHYLAKIYSNPSKQPTQTTQKNNSRPCSADIMVEKTRPTRSGTLASGKPNEDREERTFDKQITVVHLPDYLRPLSELKVFHVISVINSLLREDSIWSGLPPSLPTQSINACWPWVVSYVAHPWFNDISAQTVSNVQKALGEEEDGGKYCFPLIMFHDHTPVEGSAPNWLGAANPPPGRF